MKIKQNVLWLQIMFASWIGTLGSQLPALVFKVRLYIILYHAEWPAHARLVFISYWTFSITAYWTTDYFSQERTAITIFTRNKYLIAIERWLVLNYNFKQSQAWLSYIYAEHVSKIYLTQSWGKNKMVNVAQRRIWETDYLVTERKNLGTRCEMFYVLQGKEL